MALLRSCVAPIPRAATYSHGIRRYTKELAICLHEFRSARATKREVLPEAVLTRALAWTDLAG